MTEQPKWWTAELPTGWTGIARDSNTRHYWCTTLVRNLPTCVGCGRLMTDLTIINPCAGVDHD